MTSLRLALAAVAMAALVACSESEPGGQTSPSVTICDPDAAPQAAADLPDVAMIDVAIEALRGELGAEPEFFEVNATPQLVNMFVALNDATMVQAWLYADGELSTQPAREAVGGTFTADLIAVDPGTVFDTVRAEVPDAVVTTFYVHGNGEGGVQYGLLASTVCGGGFDITIGPGGAVLAVDPA
ncbi:MAG: hypothetical protein ACKOYG_01340 [Ilumatobacteraceae bacterium]